jgi:autotransporter family porin
VRAATLGLVVHLSALSACTVETQVAHIDGDGGVTPSPAFLTLPAGSPLPDEATCAAKVKRSSWEPRPANTTANHRTATAAELAQLLSWDDAQAFDPRALAFQARLTGDFTGTTDEIIQWVACKWGFNVDHIRAEAVASSGWRQAAQTDWTPTDSGGCPPDAATRQGMNGPECATTYGILQITWRYNKTAWPLFRESTPFHLDYAFGLRRVCLEGWDLSQADRAPAGIPYAKDDEWGCAGAYYSGQWHDGDAEGYITDVKGQLAGRAWTQPDF